jgi:hypothetical protein
MNTGPLQSNDLDHHQLAEAWDPDRQAEAEFTRTIIRAASEGLKRGIDETVKKLSQEGLPE